LCTYDGASYNDTELHDDMKDFNGNKIVIIDHCFSGGFGDNLGTLPNTFFGATCSKSGYGYDVSKFQNGAFTYAWQEVIASHLPDTLCNLFEIVKTEYSGSAAIADEPTYICTNKDIVF
jgi:hypothetical protein